MHEIIIPGVILAPGTILRWCTRQACVSFKVRGARVRAGGNPHQLVEVAGSLALDPMIVYYEDRLRAGDLPKVAQKKARKKFGGVSRAQFYRRKAAR
jgi:hypothetical protein